MSIAFVAFTPREGVRLLWVILIGLSTLLGETYFLLTEQQLTVEHLDQMWEQVTVAAVSDNPEPGLTNIRLIGPYHESVLRAFFATALLVFGLFIKPPPVNFLKHRIFYNSSL